MNDKKGVVSVTKEVFDDDLSPELRANRKNTKKVDQALLERFIKTHFPIYRTDLILIVAKFWINLSENQTKFEQYANQLTGKEISLLIEGIHESTIEELL